MKRCKDGVQKVSSWKYLTNLTTVPPVFLEHQAPHSCYPPWTPFRMCQRATAAAAQDSVTKETDGKGPGQAPICCWHPQRLNHLVFFVFGFWLHLDNKSHFCFLFFFQGQCKYFNIFFTYFILVFLSYFSFSFFKFILFYFLTLQYCIGFAYIKMNPPQVYMCSPFWILLPLPFPYHPSGSSQCTSPKHPVSCIKPRLVTHFIYDIIHVSMPFSQIFPPSPCATESIRLFYTSVSLLLSRIQGYRYHLSKFHIYALVYCIGVFFFLAYLTLYNRLQFHPPH